MNVLSYTPPLCPPSRSTPRGAWCCQLEGYQQQLHRGLVLAVAPHASTHAGARSPLQPHAPPGRCALSLSAHATLLVPRQSVPAGCT
eukprot:156990-Rhodomonas_salina.2